MATDFSTITARPFIGAPYSQPVTVCGPSPTGMPPKSVPIDINWLPYWQAAGQPTTAAVEIDLSKFTTQQVVLDRITAIKIDNTNSFCPVYVIFPDNEIVACAPNNITTVPVITSAQRCKVVAQNLQDGFIPTTRIWFYNIFLQGFVDPLVQTTFPQWRGSPSIQRSNILTPGYASPALGDQAEQVVLALQTVNSLGLWNTPRPSGFIYLTGMVFNALNPQFQGSSNLSRVNLASLTSGTLYDFRFFASDSNTANFIPPVCVTVFSQSGLQLRLDATETWLLSNTQILIHGAAQLFTEFTFSEE